MNQSVKSLATGAASGLLTYAASIFAVGLTSSFTMPRSFSSGLWEALVVLGLGAGLVAFLIHFFSIRLMGARIPLALVAFALTVTAIMIPSGLLAFYYKVLLAWLAGVLLASVIYHWLRPNNSFKPTPLRGAA